MTIFNYAPAEPAPVTLAVILYWVLRGLTFAIATALGVYVLFGAFVWLPFHAVDGYTPEFEDRVAGVIGDFLLFIAIVIPHPWSLSLRGFSFRIAMIVLTVSWVVLVDIVAFNRGLTNVFITARVYTVAAVALLLLVTLFIQRRRRLAH